MAYDPLTGYDDGAGSPIDFDQVARAAAQARGAGMPIAAAMPGPATPGLSAPVDPAGVQRAVGQARAQGVPPMLASPTPQGPGLGQLGIPGMPQMSIFPPQPARREVERSTSSWSQRNMGKEEKAAVGELAQGYDAQIAAQGKGASAAQNRALVEADNADAEATFRESKARRTAALVAEGEKQLKDSMTAYKAEFEKFRKMDLKDYFAGEEGTVRGVVAALAVAAGELGRMRPGAGGENVGVQLVNQAIQQDFMKQKLAIEKQKEVLLQAGEQMQVVERWHTHAMNMLGIKEAAAYDAVISRNTSNLKALGMSEEEAKADAANALLRTQKAAAIQSVFEGTRRQIGGTIEKQLVENQGMPGAAGGMTPYQTYQMGRQAREDAEKDQKRVVYDWDGRKAMVADEGEGRAIRADLGQAKSIVQGLEPIKAEVDQLGLLDRAIPSWSEKQQGIAGKVNTLLAPISQKLGSGTPQDREAARTIDNVTASIRQNPETAKKNLEFLQGFLKNHFQQRFESTVIPETVQASPARPAAAPAQSSSPAGGYGPVETRTTKSGETVKVRRNLSTGKLEEVQ